MSTNVIQIPAAGSPITVHDVVQIESTIARQVVTITDISALDEMRAKADALARYLAGKELHGPMLGAQRRIEARIGQLLGEPNHAPGSLPREGNSISGTDRQRFRLLARGFEVLTDEQWRQSRRALIALLQERFATPARSDGGTVLPEHHASVTDGSLTYHAREIEASGREAGDPEMPTAEEIAEMDAAAEREYFSSIAKVVESDDRLAAADAEIKRQAKLIADLTERRNSYQSLVAVREQWIKDERRKNTRLERLIKRLKLQVENLQERLAERIAIQEEPAR
jgi:hypothetical protein